MHLKLVPSESSTDVAESRKTVQSATQDREEDVRFSGCKDIIRDLYTMPTEHHNLSLAEREKMLASMGEMKVYPFHEDTHIDIPPPVRTFKEAFGHNPAIMQEIEKNGFTSPSPIQSQMWPVLLSGKDCIGVSQTGSGKTLAFLLPAFIHIDAQYSQYSPGEPKPRPSVLVLTPTRELAQQIEREVRKYSYNGYKSVCLYGGGPRREQMADCKDGVEIVIATPGRLADLSAEGVIDLARVSYVVLDEADRMLDMGFETSIRRILFETRPDRLVALTSATWPEQVRYLTDRYTKEAVMVVVGSLDLKACQSVTQYFEFVQHDQRFDRVLEMVEFLNKTHGKNYKLIIFVKSKVMADHMSSEFCMKGINSQGLHGGRSQTDRETSLTDLRSGAVQILVATDLASRGLDIPDITHVVNFDFPNDIEEYVHRVGRTGRAGRRGEAMSFMGHNDRSNFAGLISILEKSGQEVPQQLLHEHRRYVDRLERGLDKPRPMFRQRKQDTFSQGY